MFFLFVCNSDITEIKIKKKSENIIKKNFKFYCGRLHQDSRVFLNPAPSREEINTKSNRID